MLHFTISTTVLKRRKEDGIGFKVNDFLYRGAKTASAVCHTTIFKLLLNPGYMDILRVAHTGDSVLASKPDGERTMDAGRDHCLFQWRPNNRSFGETRWNLAVGRDKQIGVKCLSQIPRIGECNLYVSLMPYDSDTLGITERERVALLAACAGRTAATGCEKRDNAVSE